MSDYMECSICKQKKWCRLYSGTIAKKVIRRYVCDECKKHYYMT